MAYHVNSPWSGKSPWSRKKPVVKISLGKVQPRPHLGDVVLAKLEGYPFWPAKIVRCDWEKPAWRNKWKLEATVTQPERFWCSFFGDGTVEWIPRSSIKKFVPKTASRYLVSARSSNFVGQKKAFEAAEVALASRYTQSARTVDVEHAPKLKLGHLVMAKLSHYPYWPAIVSKCFWSGKENGKWERRASPSEPVCVWVIFIGEDSGNWVEIENIEMFTPKIALQLQCQESSSFFEEQKKAIQIANDIFKNKGTGGDATRKTRSSGSVVSSGREARPLFKPWVVEDYIEMKRSEEMQP